MNNIEIFYKAEQIYKNKNISIMKIKSKEIIIVVQSPTVLLKGRRYYSQHIIYSFQQSECLRGYDYLKVFDLTHQVTFNLFS